MTSLQWLDLVLVSSNRVTDDNMDLIWGGGWAKGRALFETELTSAHIAESGAAADGGA